MANAVTDATFRELVLSNPKPVLVDFWAEWCGPCRKLAPVIDELATEFAGRVDVFKMDVDSNRATAANYNIMSIPTVLIFSGGEIANIISSNPTKLNLKKALEAVL